VPVLRFADGLSLSQISGNVKEFAKKAKDKKLQPADWEGSTFTISNLGMFDEEIVYAEDYYLSKEVDPKKFSIPFWAIVYTSSRRFSKKKPIWMIKMAIRSFINRNNKEFFMKDWGYWD
jgi:pyruvate/2-oxoglutarate dehydrogenase complex dihydrolipoamide acyltransferase (E2) component